MSSSRRLRALLSLVVAAAVPVQGTAAAAVSAATRPCEPGVSVSLVAADGARPTGRDATYIVADLEPGDRLQRRMRVCNGTDAPLRVNLYSNAAAINDGGFLPVGSPRAENDLSRWTSVQPSTLLLQPDVPADVAITISVPVDADAGERYAVVYAEVPPAAGGTGVGVASRVGVRQYVFVRGDAAPRTDFTIQALTAARSNDGRPVVQAEVRNTGDRAIDVAGTLRLTDGPGGISAGPFPATLGTTIAPGQSAPVEVLLDRALPAGPWLATLTLRSGDVERRAEARITFPDEAGSENAPVEAKNLPLRENPNVLIPIAGGLIGLIALLLLLALLRRRPKKADDDEEQQLAPAG